MIEKEISSPAASPMNNNDGSTKLTKLKMRRALSKDALENDESKSFKRSPSPIDSTCTICGLRYNDRLAFNSHIKAHLKEKLNTRRRERPSQDEKFETNSKDDIIRQKRPRVSLPSPPCIKQLAQTFPPVLECPPELVRIQHPNPISSEASLENRKMKSPKALLASHSELMAELGACKPIPPEKNDQLASNSSELISIDNQESLPLPPFNCITTPDISDMEEDLMSYEMEMNRIDFNNDLSSILDQIEKDFESPSLGSLPASMVVDTPPDSDNENLSEYISNIGGQVPGTIPLVIPTDLLGFDQFASNIVIPESCIQSETIVNLKKPDTILAPISSVESNVDFAKNVASSEVLATTSALGVAADQIPSAFPRVTLPEFEQEKVTQVEKNAAFENLKLGTLVQQSPSSLAKVGPLPAKALAVLSHLPSKLFSCEKERLVNVVKVERSNILEPAAAAAQTTSNNNYTLINIECLQTGRDGEVNGKLLETYRAIDTGSEIKLLLNNNSTGMFGDIVQKKSASLQDLEEDCGYVTDFKSDDATDEGISLVSSPEETTSCLSTSSFDNSSTFNRSLSSTSTFNSSTSFTTTFNNSSTSQKNPSTTSTLCTSSNFNSSTSKKKKSFECSICPTTFLRKAQLKDHISIAHDTSSGLNGGDKSPKAMLSSSSSSNLKLYRKSDSLKCQRCHVLFRERSKLTRHKCDVNKIAAGAALKNESSSLSTTTSFLSTSQPDEQKKKLQSLACR